MVKQLFWCRAGNLLRWGFCFCLLGSIHLASADESPEAQLQAVKQALVDLALGAEIQVDSLAYMDSEGKLHESSVLSSNVGVRGVRVLSYLEEAKKVSTATIKATIVPDGTCREDRIQLRRQVAVNILRNSEHTEHDSDRVGDHSLHELAQLAANNLVDALDLDRGWSPSMHSDYGSSYERHLLGKSSDSVPYRIDIKFAKSSVPNSRLAAVKRGVTQSADVLYASVLSLTGGARTRPWPATEIDYELSLTDRSTNLSLWTLSGHLTYPPVERGYFKEDIPLSLVSDIQDLARRAVIELNDSISCRPHQFELRQDRLDKTKLVINAGLVAGMSVGDQFLISTNPDLLKQALSENGLASLSLARVESVAPHSSVLVQTAGPEWKTLENLSRLVATYF